MLRVGDQRRENEALRRALRQAESRREHWSAPPDSEREKRGRLSLPASLPGNPAAQATRAAMRPPVGPAVKPKHHSTPSLGYGTLDTLGGTATTGLISTFAPPKHLTYSRPAGAMTWLEEEDVDTGPELEPGPDRGAAFAEIPPHHEPRQSFRAALRTAFRDPFRERKATEALTKLKQRGRPLMDYVIDFRAISDRITTLNETQVINAFLDGLDRPVADGIFNRGPPEDGDLQQWIDAAGVIETNLANYRAYQRRQEAARLLRSSRSDKTPSAPKLLASQPSPASAPDRERRKQSGLCHECGGKGHFASVCPTRLAKSKTPSQQDKGQRPSDKRPADRQRSSDKSAGKPGGTRALLAPVSPALAARQEDLAKPIIMRQVDGAPVGGDAIRHATSALALNLGSHWERISLTIAPVAGFSILLGMDWMDLHRPEIDWDEKRLVFSHPNCKLHFWYRDQPDAPPVAVAGTVVPWSESPAMLNPWLRAMGLYSNPDDAIPACYRDLAEAFSEEECNQLPPHRPTDCAIELVPGAKLPKAKLYNMSPAELRELRAFVDKNLARGFIRPATLSMAAPVLFAKKKDGTLRLCTDYRAINAVSRVNAYPLPLIKDLLSRLGEGRIFTKLDLRDAYFRVRIAEGDEWKTAFNTPLGQFEYLVMPFGLSGSPGVFMNVINEALHDLLYRGVVVYLDDVLIYSRGEEEHTALVREVLRRLANHKLYAKLPKCEFHKPQVDFLGYRVSGEGIGMDPAKVQAVLDWEIPRTRRQLQSFLGFANFYRDFLPGFSKVTLPLTDLLKTKGKGARDGRPGAPLPWTQDCTQAFERLKHLFTSEPILAHPEIDKPFVVQVDASNEAVGGVLLQRGEGGKLRPCAYLSRKFSPTERNWPIWEKEAAAVKTALSTWRHFLEGSPVPFEVWTDHKNLEALRKPRTLSAKQIRWADFFSRFDFTLVHIPGRKNFMADALSRMFPGEHRPSRVDTVFTPKQLGLLAQTRSQTKAGRPAQGPPPRPVRTPHGAALDSPVGIPLSPGPGPATRQPLFAASCPRGGLVQRGSPVRPRLDAQDNPGIVPRQQGCGPFWIPENLGAASPPILVAGSPP
ncbi:uncharacterized protein LOC143820028 [Paroedura picta]|uniref:uncharacterized protein LOC143820028 n=1 Tax=Paroedura picta TaxID=143630 RepID=UPI004055D542